MIIETVAEPAFHEFCAHRDGHLGLIEKLRALEKKSAIQRTFIQLIESAGANLFRQAELFVKGGQSFANLSRMSAMGLPIIAIVNGSSTAGGACQEDTIMVELTHEHRELARTYRRLIDDEINPNVDEWEAAGIFPAHEVFKKLGDLGLLGVTKPEQYGGLGLDYSYGAVINETSGHINCGGVPMAIGVQTDMATPALARFGSPELCNNYLAPAIAGDMVACIGVSEPSAGSDVASIKSKAVRDGDDYVINGSKTYITNGTQADWMCMLVNTGEGPSHRNKSLIVVPLRENGQRAPGVTVARKLKKLGMHASDTAELYFDDVRVPARNLIGEEGRGFVYQMMQFQEERLCAALSALTGCTKSIEETVEYTRGRKAFGQSILDNQVVQYRLGELMTETEALRALIWKAVDLHVAGEDCTMLASMAKLKGTRLSREVQDACLQYWGGMGYMDETPISRRFRDSRLGSIGGGADEVMLGIIAKYAGLQGDRA